jgi:DNA-binding transcriptional MerR regulator
LQNGDNSTLSVSAAATRLGVSPQSIRNWLGEGKLQGSQRPNGRWEVDGASVEAIRAKSPRSTPAEAASDEVKNQLAALRAGMEELQSDRADTRDLIRALERERDRYRGEASAVRAAALSLSGAARELDASVRGLLDVLALQADALTQLLTPNSPDELSR